MSKYLKKQIMEKPTKQLVLDSLCYIIEEESRYGRVRNLKMLFRSMPQKHSGRSRRGVKN